MRFFYSRASSLSASTYLTRDSYKQQHRIYDGRRCGGEQFYMSENIKYATIMVATVPILLIYPFIQKYFVKGVMIGAVKDKFLLLLKKVKSTF